jgi:hypothetical protein
MTQSEFESALNQTASLDIYSEIPDTLDRIIVGSKDLMIPITDDEERVTDIYKVNSHVKAQLWSTVRVASFDEHNAKRVRSGQVRFSPGTTNNWEMELVT